MFTKVGRRLRAFVAQFWEISFGPIFDFIADRLGDALSIMLGKILARRSPGPVEQLFARLIAPDNPRLANELAEALQEINPVVAFFMSFFIAHQAVGQLIQARLTGAMERISHEELEENPVRPPPVEAIVASFLRRYISDDQAEQLLRRHGIAPGSLQYLAIAMKDRLAIGTMADLARRGVISYGQYERYAIESGWSPEEARMVFESTRRLLTAAELVVAVRRGGMPIEEARERARQIGIEPDDFDAIMAGARAIPTPDQLLSLWLRGELDDLSLSIKLKEHGYTDDDIDRLKSLAYFIPPPSDLIRMAVREVFTPEVVERFGQMQDFPEAFKEWAAKQGISEFWAKAYWAAHWDLPSITQGFEMFHREVITREELELLLRALDVMPFWREKLLQISYNPITRVDILRMYQLGVIDRDEVERRYRHLGYSPEDARLLADYTVRLAAEREKDLSRSDIEELLEKGAISRDQAKGLLLRSGYTEEIAELILARAELRIANRELADEVEILKTEFLEGNITLQDVAARLSSLGVMGTMVDTILAQLERERRKRRRSLTVAQIERAYKKGLLGPGEARERLRIAGYTDRDIDILLQLWAGGD